jgi:hypothetical protein
MATKVGTAWLSDECQDSRRPRQGVKATIAESGLVASWNSEPGDIGIPATIPTYEGSGFAQRIELMIEREVVDFALATPQAHLTRSSERIRRKSTAEPVGFLDLYLLRRRLLARGPIRRSPSSPRR